MVGTVGQILGDAGVNIAGMQVSRDAKGGQALVALSVDSAIPAETLDEIQQRHRRGRGPGRQPGLSRAVLAPAIDFSSGLVLNRGHAPGPGRRLLDAVHQGAARRRRRRLRGDQRTAPHPPGTEVDPRAWLAAVDDATAGLLERADAVSVGGQQHGMVALGEDGEPVRDALLWNDTRSAPEAAALIAEHGGPQACADAIGSVLVASFTVTKLRWLRDHEPDRAERVRRGAAPA